MNAILTVLNPKTKTHPPYALPTYYWYCHPFNIHRAFSP